MLFKTKCKYSHPLYKMKQEHVEVIDSHESTNEKVIYHMLNFQELSESPNSD